MPKGPKGEKRPADVIGNAVHVMRIATADMADVSTNYVQNTIKRCASICAGLLA